MLILAAALALTAAPLRALPVSTPTLAVSETADLAQCFALNWC